MQDVQAPAMQATEMPWPSPRGAWWAVAVFTLAAVLSYTDRQILGLLVDPIRADLRISDTQISLLQGVAFALIYAFAGIGMGRLADVLKRRRVLVLGVLLWTAATIACGLGQTFTQLFCARLFVGIGEATLSPAVMSMVADMFPPKRRGTVIGVLMMGMVLGSGAAFGIGGGLIHAAEAGVLAGVPILGSVAPWRASLLVLGVPGLCVALLLLTVREPSRRHDGRDAGQSRYTMREVIGVMLARGRLLIPLLLAGAVMAMVDFALMSWTPTLLLRNHGLSAQSAGFTLGILVIAAGATGAIVGGLIADRLVKRGGLRQRIVGAALLATVAIPVSAIGATSNATQVFILFAGWAFLSAAVATVQVTAIQETVPNEMRGFAISLIAFANIAIGLGLGATAPALLSDHLFHDPHSLAASLSVVVTPASLAGCALLWFASFQTGPRRTEPGAASPAGAVAR